MYSDEVRMFIDDSGSFSWRNPGVSLFAGLIIRERYWHSLEESFLAWKKSIIGGSKRELKGESLTENQLESFTYKVLEGRDPLITVAGADTRLTQESIVEEARNQTSQIAKRAGEMVLEVNPQNSKLAQQYSEMAGWLKRRSTVNFLWLDALEETILQTFQHSVVYYMDEDDDEEFQDIEILIDRSFITRREHLNFWREYLRNGLLNRAHRPECFMMPDTWRKRNHPFRRQYCDGDGILNFRDLFTNHTNFGHSREHIGLQLADICANICYRFYRGTPTAAYNNLRPRIVGKHGRPATFVHRDSRCLIGKDDSVHNHVKVMDTEAMRRRAAGRRFTEGASE